MRIHVSITLCAVLAASPAAAQVRVAPVTPSVTALEDEQPLAPPQQRQTPLDTNQAGGTARSSVGQVGQRQTRDTAATETGIKPMARVTSRIQNRVQNRFRTRIDRTYDPQAGTTDPFAVAEDRTRTGGRPR